MSYYMYDWNTWTENGMDYDQSDSSTSFLNFMLNGYWDFQNRSNVTPFLTGGLGFSRAEIDDQNNKHDDTVFAGQVGAGASYDFSTRLSLDLTYRLHITQDLEVSDNFGKTEIENVQNQFLLGARYKF